MANSLEYRKSSEFPYNPEDVNIRLQHFRVLDLIKMVENETLDIWSEDDLQRMHNLWNNNKKSLFIESLLIRLPIPLFYLDGSAKTWRVIDGLQRLHTIVGYVSRKYTERPYSLKGLEYLTRECEGKTFDELPSYLQTRLLSAEVEGYVINPGTPPEVKYNIFKRINTGGLPLNGQEIRNAFCRGIPAELTKEMAAEQIFKLATDNRVTTRRMEDREYATRFIAFQIYGPEAYAGKMDIFLTSALMEIYNFSPNNIQHLHNSFIESLSKAYEIWGNRSFYRLTADGQKKGRKPNKALFDAIIYNLSKLTDAEFNILNSKAQSFIHHFIKFMNEDEAFYRSINDTTGSKKSVITRFERFEWFLNNFIE